MCKGGTTSTSSSSSTMASKPTKEEEGLKEEDFPIVGKIWLKLYRFVPSLTVPFSNVSFSFAIVSAIIFIELRLLSNSIFQSSYIGFPTDTSASMEASASVVGIVHSSLLVPGLLVAFMTHKYNPSEHIDLSPATHWKEYVDALLQFCTGYMIYDAVFIYMLRLDPTSSSPWIPELQADDILFLVHHFMTTTYMTLARAYQAGHMSAMMCMLLGEASNPLHNSYFICQIALKQDCCNGIGMQQFNFYIETSFAFVYASLRTIIGPYYCVPMSWNLLFSNEAKQNLPIGIRCFWVFMIMAVLVGSYSWVIFTLQMLQKNVLGMDNQEL